MPSKRLPYDDVVLTAPVTIAYQRYSTKGAAWFMARAIRGLMELAGIAKSEIDGLCASSFTLAPDSAVGLTQHLGLTPRWLDHIPMGGAAGIVALRRAARAVQCGDAEIVACVAGDTNHIDSFRLNLANFSQFARDAIYPTGSGGPNASFALLTHYYLRRFGDVREQFGRMCVAQRDNALKNPLALFKKPLTLDEYLNARSIADPIRLFDCVMPCAGADAFLVMRRERARDLGLPAVRPLSTIERHNAFPEDPIQVRGGWVMDRDDFYGLAGVKPEDIDVVQTYDDYPVINFMQLEDLGFCGKGEAGAFVAERDLTIGGDFPVNTSGGQLSMGQAGAAGGFLGLVEAIRQLIREPLGDPAVALVKDAELALVSGFGMITYDRGLSTGAAILARD